MEVPARRQPMTIRLRRLAARMRALREQVGLTREQVTAQTDVNGVTLYRLESGLARPQRRTMTTLLDAYGVTDRLERAELMDLLTNATKPDWLQKRGSELRDPYATYISLEGEASDVRNYESLFVPGLLQTEDYARAVIKGVLPLANSSQVDRLVQARLQRQVTLTRSEPLQLWAIVDEAVLRRQVGGREVMTAQLRHLAEMSEHPHVMLQVLPFSIGAHAGMPGSFVVMGFPDDADQPVVYIDSMAGDLFLEADADVRRFAAIFEHLRAAALSPADSARFAADLSVQHHEGR